jgi:tRNA threonylcarbamoyladenosine biosynthesis protein TsaE
MKQIYITRSPEETKTIAVELGKKASPGNVFALRGELGSGKTIIAKGIGLGLDVADDITSPTFTIMEEYDGRLKFFHFDLYRINHKSELDALFFEEYWEGKGVCVIEWAERAQDRLPNDLIIIDIEYVDSSTRRIIIERADS